MKLIMVVDDMAIFREPIAASLRRAGYKTACASNGKEALALIEQERPGLILLDVAMPVMDGISCLLALRANDATRSIPVIILSAMSERDAVLQAIAIGVHGYLLKSQFSLEDLLERVRQATGGAESGAAPAPKLAAPVPPAPPAKPLAPAAFARGVARVPAARPVAPTSQTPVSPPAAPRASGVTPAPQAPSPAPPARPAPTRLPPPPAPPNLDKATTLEHVLRDVQLRAVPAVLHHVMMLSQSSTSSFEDVARSVRQDHALSVKVLRVANSSLFGTGRKAETLADAMQRIGMSGVRNAVAAVLAIEHFESASAGGLVLHRFWEHSLGTATLSELVGHRVGAQATELLFLAGLLHDVGRVILSSTLPEHYAKAVTCAAERGVDLHDVERETFGVTHDEVTHLVLERWSTPEGILEAASLHERPVNVLHEAVRDPQPSLIVGFANRLAHATLLGDSGNRLLLPLANHVKALKLDPKTIHSLTQSAASRALDNSMFYASRGIAQLQESFATELGRQCSVRPKMVVLPPADPALEVFLDRLSWLDAQQPQIAVVAVGSERDLKQRLIALQEMERRTGRSLAVVIACVHPGLTPATELLGGRACAVVRLPGPYDTLIQAIVRVHEQHSQRTEVAV